MAIPARIGCLLPDGVASSGVLTLSAAAVGAALVAAFVAVESSANLAFVDDHVRSSKEASGWPFHAVRTVIKFGHLEFLLRL